MFKIDVQAHVHKTNKNFIKCIGSLVPDGSLRLALSKVEVCPEQDDLPSRLEALLEAIETGAAIYDDE